MSEGITARVEVPSGMAYAAAATSTRQLKTVNFFIKPLGIPRWMPNRPAELTRYESIVCRPHPILGKLKYTAPVDASDTSSKLDEGSNRRVPVSPFFFRTREPARSSGRCGI